MLYWQSTLLANADIHGGEVARHLINSCIGRQGGIDQRNQIHHILQLCQQLKNLEQGQLIELMYDDCLGMRAICNFVERNRGMT
ncbi:hypothetical protein D3C76_727150 [compost metagenome]